MKQRKLFFSIPIKEVLNSNVSLHRMVKSNMVRKLRESAQIIGAEHHTHSELSKELVNYHRSLQSKNNVKATSTKKMKKSGATEEQISEAMADIERTANIPDMPIVPYEFSGQFEALCIVHTPTKRHIDPPNLWPTFKPLLDGLTDSGWWKDDDSSHLVRTSFERGENSKEKNFYQFTIIISEII